MSRQKLTQSGFTLLELLIALTILALAITGASRIMTTSANSMLRSSQTQQAMEVGFNHLAQLSKSDTLQTGQFSGVYSNGFAWALKIQKQALDPNNTAPAIVAVSLDLLVSYETGQQRFHDLVLHKPNAASPQQP